MLVAEEKCRLIASLIGGTGISKFMKEKLFLFITRLSLVSGRSLFCYFSNFLPFAEFIVSELYNESVISLFARFPFYGSLVLSLLKSLRSEFLPATDQGLLG